MYKTLEQQKHNTLQIQSWKMLGWLVSIQVLVAFVARSYAPLGVLIGSDLSLTKAQLGLLPAALFFGQAVISIPVGFLTDQVGTRRMLLYLTICLGGSFVIMSFASSFEMVLLLIIIGGLGYGSSHPASNRGILYWFKGNKRGTAMGMKQMGITAGSALAALVLLPVATMWGWRSSLFIASTLLIVSGMLVYKFYREPTVQKRSSKDSVHFFSSLKAIVQNKGLLLVSLAASGLQDSQTILSTYI